MRFGDLSWYSRPGAVQRSPVADLAIQPAGVPLVAGVELPPTAFPVQPGYVRLTTVTGDLGSADYCMSGEAVLVTDRSAGGWNVVERPGRVGLTVWTGGAPLGLELPITLDGLAIGRDVGDGWRRLMALWNPGHGEQPPVLRIAGHVPGTDRKWVVDTLDLGDDTVRLGSRLVRQSATLRLLEFVDVDVAKAATRADAKKARKDVPRTVKVTASTDTLRLLAKHYLHDGRRWKEIAKLNKGLHDPNRKLKVGADIRIPAADNDPRGKS